MENIITFSELISVVVKRKPMNSAADNGLETSQQQQDGKYISFLHNHRAYTSVRQAQIKVGIGPSHCTTIDPPSITCVTLYTMMNCLFLQ